MAVKTQGGQKIEAAKVESKVLVALGNGFKNYNRAGLLWTSEKPYSVTQAEANELLAIVADNRRPFVLFTPPPKKVEVEGVEVAQRPTPESKRPPTHQEAQPSEKAVAEIGTAEEAAELGLPVAGAATPEGEKIVTV